MSTFCVFIEGRTHVVIHNCLITGQLLSGVLVSKGAKCDIIDSEICDSAEDGVFFVSGSGSVRGCRLFRNGMSAIEIDGTSDDVLVENNVMYGNGSGLSVLQPHAAVLSGQGVWLGKVKFVANQVIDSSGPALTVDLAKMGKHLELGRNVFSGNADDLPLVPALEEALERGICTRHVTGTSHEYQPWFECITCGLDSLNSQRGICRVCFITCHAGHHTIQHSSRCVKSFCDCTCCVVVGADCQ